MGEMRVRWDVSFYAVTVERIIGRSGVRGLRDPARGSERSTFRSRSRLRTVGLVGRVAWVFGPGVPDPMGGTPMPLQSQTSLPVNPIGPHSTA